MAAQGFLAQLLRRLVRFLGGQQSTQPNRTEPPRTQPGPARPQPGRPRPTQPQATRPRPTEPLTRPVGRPPGPRRPESPSVSESGSAPAYAGDFTGVATLEYTPKDDGRPDPGEVVWAWVPFEEDHSQGKDRPVLVIARHGGELLGLMLTSKDHDRDEAQEARHGRHWLDVGTGGWDRQGRPSEVRLDRILRLDPAAVRREGAALDRARYEQVAAEVRSLRQWR